MTPNPHAPFPHPALVGVALGLAVVGLLVATLFALPTPALHAVAALTAPPSPLPYGAVALVATGGLTVALGRPRPRTAVAGLALVSLGSYVGLAYFFLSTGFQ